MSYGQETAVACNLLLDRITLKYAPHLLRSDGALAVPVRAASRPPKNPERRRDKIDKHEILRLYSAGEMTCAAVAAKIGCTSPYVFHVLRAHGVTRTRSAAQRLRFRKSASREVAA